MHDDRPVNVLFVLILIVISFVGISFYPHFKSAFTASRSTHQPELPFGVPIKDKTIPETASALQSVSSSDVQKYLNLYHHVENGWHVYTGIIDVPRDCDGVHAQATIIASVENEAVISLSNAFTDKTGQPCTGALKSKPFSVSFPGGENMMVRALIENQPVAAEVIEIGGEEGDPILQ